MLFRPGSKVNVERWPCPRAKEGIDACRKRFWSDAERRRSIGAERRLFDEAHDTFACRFYQRISCDSPCERLSYPTLPEVTIDFHYLADREDTKYDTVTLMTDDDEGRVYTSSYALHDSNNVEEIADHYLRVRFRNIVSERSYSLKIDPGGVERRPGERFKPYFIFRFVILPPSDGLPRIREDVDYAAGEGIAVNMVPEEEQSVFTEEEQMLASNAGMPLPEE